MSNKSKSQLRTENSNNFPNNNSGFITPEKLRSFNGDMIDSMLVSADSSSFITNPLNENLQVNGNITASGHISASTYYGDGSNLTGVATSIDTGSFFTTGSVTDATLTFTQGDGSTVVLEVNNVSASIQAEDLVITVKNVSGVTLPAGTAVKATGVVGENITIVSASADNPSLMPAIGVLNQEIANNGNGECYIAGRLENINTSNLVAGAAVYVNNNGGLTATKPTGSDLIQNIGIAAKINATEGELVIQGSGRTNDVPNIPQGQIWVGNVNGVATPTSTGSFAKIDENNTFTGTQNFTNISVSGTGSFGYIQSVTGSAKIIGDAFIILNNDTPAERYAGIKVYDSGSTRDTASFQWDGQSHDWFYEFSSSAAHEYGVALFGPEYTTLGTPTYLTNNTIPKGSGGHHLNDSNITDDGSTITLGSDIAITGNITGNNTFTGINTFTAGPQVVSGSNGYVKQQFTAPGTNQEKAFVEIDGANVNGNSFNRVFYGMADYPSFGTRFEDYFAIEYYDGFGYNFGSEFNLNGVTTVLQTTPSGSASGDVGKLEIKDRGDTQSQLTVQANFIGIGRFGNLDHIGFGQVGVGESWFYHPISASSWVSASAFIGDGSQLTGVAGGIFTQTGSYYSTTNDLEVTGSFNVQGGIGGNHQDLTIASNTASIDLTTGNTFTVTLVSSADTHIDVSTFSGAGQSLNLLVKQPTSGNTGSISFSPDFKFGQGSSYQPTTANSAEDIVSFTRFGNHLYGTFINNFS